MNVPASKALRDFLFQVFASVAPRLAFSGRTIQNEDQYAAARNKWVGQDDPAAARASCDWFENHLGEILENEAEAEFQDEKFRAREARVTFDAKAARERVSRKPSAFKAKVAELKLAENTRAAARNQGAAAEQAG